MEEDIKNKLFENKNKNKLVKRKKDDDGNEFKRKYNIETDFEDNFNWNVKDANF